MRTRRPCRISAATKCCPINPLPPVTSVCITTSGPSRSKPEHFRSPGLDHELEAGRLQNRQVRRIGDLRISSSVNTSLVIRLFGTDPIDDQSADVSVFAKFVDCS